VWALLRRLFHTPRALSGYFRNRRWRRGRQALSQGMVAVAAGDRDAARRNAEAALRLLPEDPLARLLDAQSAQLRGDYRRVGRVFEDMLSDPATEVVALRGLYAQARQAGDEGRASSLAERAYASNPRLEWASSAKLKRHAAERDWPAVLAVLESQRRNGLLSEEEAKKKRAVVHLAQAMAAEGSDRDAALDLAEKALKLDPRLVPAAVLAGRVQFDKGHLRRGLKSIEKAWAINPHPDLAQAYAHARPGDSAQDRLARIRDLIKLSPGGEEGAIALAKAAVEARDWRTARQALAEHAAGRPRARICALMAEIEEGEFGDKGRAREWLARAVVAPRDPVWVADGFVSDEWQPVSPATGELGAFAWKVPLEGIGYTAPYPETAQPPALPPLIEAETKPAPPAVETPPEVHDQPIAAPEPPQERPAVEPREEPSAEVKRPAPQLATAPAAVPEQKPANDRPRVFPVPRQPDDPGPEGEAAAEMRGWTRKLAGS
jgi:HemY protein